MRRAPQLGQNPLRSPKAPTVGATEGDQVLRMAGVTLHAQKTMLKTATLEICLELLADVIWQHPALKRPLRLKSRVVFFDKLVKKGLLRAMALVLRHTLAAAGFPASWQLQHNRILAIRCLTETIRRQPVLHYS